MKTDRVSLDGLIYTLSSTVDRTESIAQVVGVMNPIRAQSKIVIPSDIIYKKKTYEVKEIGNGAFTGIQAQLIELPDSIKSIGMGAFEHCTKLEYIDLSQFSVLPMDLMRDCPSLTKVNLNPSLTEIHQRAFQYCTSLTNIQIPQSTKFIGAYAFEDSGISELKIPKSCIIRDGICIGCSNLIKVNLPDDIKSIPDKMFYGCIKLKSITIPDNVTNIGDFAFGNCHSLKDVRLPKSLKTIGRSIFNGCSELNKVNISVNSLSNEILSYLDSEGITVTEWDPTVVISSWDELINQ